MLIVGLGLVSGLGCGSARYFNRWGVERSGGVGSFIELIAIYHSFPRLTFFPKRNSYASNIFPNYLYQGIEPFKWCQSNEMVPTKVWE